MPATTASERGAALARNIVWRRELIFMFLFSFCYFVYFSASYSNSDVTRRSPSAAPAQPWRQPHAQLPQQDELQQRKARRFTQLFFMKRFSQTRVFEKHFNRLVKRISAMFSHAATDIKSR
jgi:hypothetical protein